MLDIVLAILVLAVLAPVIALVAALVRLRLGSPIVFKQLRPGLHGRPFKVLKFRTMTDATDPDGRPLPDEHRMTAFGSALRRLSIDELPELVNVLRGEMSLVGPRPLLMEYLPLYTAEQRRRHEVRPGITGLAQVAGRNQLVWNEKFRLDIEYVESVSISLDLEILAQTVAAVISQRGISQSGFATSERFRGTPHEASLGSVAPQDSRR